VKRVYKLLNRSINQQSEAGDHAIGLQGRDADVEKPKAGKESRSDDLEFPWSAEFTADRAEECGVKMGNDLVEYPTGAAGQQCK
jgi:hypothetical protein